MRFGCKFGFVLGTEDGVDRKNRRTEEQKSGKWDGRRMERTE